MVSKMIAANRKTCKTVYTIACVIVVAFMVGYWWFKYEVEDRDIGVVDYAPLHDAKEIRFPAVSICFANPFHDKNLRVTNANITTNAYLQYLEGRGNDYDINYDHDESSVND